VKSNFVLRTCIMVAVISFLCFGIGAWADQEISLEINQGSVCQSVYVSGISGSITYLPVRELAELINLPLKWNQDMGSVICQTYGKTTIFTPGIDIVYTVNGAVTAHKILTQPLLNQGRVYIPLRALELVGIGITYDAARDQRSIFIPDNLNQGLQPIATEKLNMVRDLIIKEKDKIPKKIGSFSTYFNPAEKSRTKNLKLAAEAINNYQIKPGEIFSFNKTVGPRTPARGYEKAIIYVNKEKVEDYGGGICQVSTTLYNTVLSASLPVLERHLHSLPVPYVLLGKDATVNYGTKDFKFKNNQKKVLVIKTNVEKNKLTIELYSLPI
jgi:hypothetical protein